MPATLRAVVDYEDDYVQSIILNALESSLPSGSYTLSGPDDGDGEHDDDEDGLPVLEIRQYEKLDFERAAAAIASAAATATSTTAGRRLINSYVIRKALIRKHFLCNTITHWNAKHPDSILKRNWSVPVEFELDYAEFLDDALVEAFELQESFARNEEGEGQGQREWWILKPGMSDRGQGIRLFSTFEELEAIFLEWEEKEPGSDEEGDGDGGEAGEGIMTSQLRHFIAQPYLDRPLLLRSEGGRKFHVRTYVIAVGALAVYVYQPMLALFAAEPYQHPDIGRQAGSSQPDLRAQLTNTCLQGTALREGSVKLFSEMDWPSEMKARVYGEINEIVRELFLAAAKGMVVHFQPLPNAFEIFGLDFLIDGTGKAWLLEVNSFPDFRQTGDDLKHVVQGLFDAVVEIAVKPFFAAGNQRSLEDLNIVQVIDPDVDKIYNR